MSEAKLSIRFGDSAFEGEGSEEWIKQQLEIFLREIHPEKATTSIKKPKEKEEQKGYTTISQGTLATFLREKQATAIQVRKFLATAVWLQRQNPHAETTTKDVAQALDQARQKPLANPSDALNQNVAKGYCVKKPNGFYVTPEGEQSLDDK